MTNPAIGFHASHEQFPPSTLLDLVRRAESAGFGAAMCSDHFQPWSERQGESGFAWAWLGAALATTSLSYGTVTAPGQRYHPAVIAQAIATLGEMFPERFWVALGSGEALNEAVTGDGLPSQALRKSRLLEVAEITRALLAGETVSHRGQVTVDQAVLWTRPEKPPPLFAAAVGPDSARMAAGWADGLVTVNQPREKLREVVDAFRSNGGEGKPMYLQVHIAYAPDEAEARAAAHDQWRTNVLLGDAPTTLASPAAFDAATALVRPDDLDDAVRISADLGRHASWLAQDLELGFERVYVHEVGRDQVRFIEAFGRDVLPQVDARVPAQSS